MEISLVLESCHLSLLYFIKSLGSDLWSICCTLYLVTWKLAIIPFYFGWVRGHFSDGAPMCLLVLMPLEVILFSWIMVIHITFPFPDPVVWISCQHLLVYTWLILFILTTKIIRNDLVLWCPGLIIISQSHYDGCLVSDMFSSWISAVRNEPAILFIGSIRICQVIWMKEVQMLLSLIWKSRSSTFYLVCSLWFWV